MIKEIGVIGTGDHKKCAIQSVVSHSDANFRMLKVQHDIPEFEHQNPKKILIPKLVDYLAVLSPSLPFLAWAKIAPQAVMAMDVVGLDMGGVETINEPFGKARGVLKKPESGTPAQAIARHFGEKVTYRPIDGYHYDAFTAGAVVAPVDHRGNVLLEHMTALWDNAVWMGCSVPLANLLADEKRVDQLIGNNVIGESTATMKSINGIRLQYLLRDLAAISKFYPSEDISMRVVYRSIDIRITGQDDLSSLTHVTNLVDANMANATPILGRMLVDTVNKFPI